MRLAFCLFQRYFVISREQKRTKLHGDWNYKKPAEQSPGKQHSTSTQPEMDWNMSVQYIPAFLKIQMMWALLTSDLVMVYTDSN